MGPLDSNTTDRVSQALVRAGRPRWTVSPVRPPQTLSPECRRATGKTRPSGSFLARQLLDVPGRRHG